MEALELLLSDGTRWPGVGRLGACDSGEVVFTTLAGGFPQALRDPSFAGQIVVFSFPMVGCCGVGADPLESSGIRARGIVAAVPCRDEGLGPDLFGWVEREGLFWMGGVDTRRLVRHLRRRGPLFGRALPAGGEGTVEVDETPKVSLVSTKVRRSYPGEGPRIVIVDYGVKEGVVRTLQARGCAVDVVPHDMPDGALLALRPDGVLLGGGPGDPALLAGEISVVRGLLGKVPFFGVGLGMQLLALALGARTERLPFGHRGGQPVIDVESKRGFVTSQNHGYVLRDDSIKGKGIVVTFRNGDDGTIEGIRHAGTGVWGVQFHPEAAPGPQESGRLFDSFIDQCREAGR